MPPPTRQEPTAPNASKVVREVLRSWSPRVGRQAKLEWLRATITEGLDDMERGDYATLRPIGNRRFYAPAS